MKTFPWWLWPNVLGLDAPVIAAIWQDMFARAFGVPLGLTERAGLFLAVWAIYAADRVADGFRLGAPEGTAARHGFAVRHRWAMLGLVVLATLAAAALACTYSFPILAGGAGLAVLVGLYFLWNQYAGRRLARGWLKEAVVGLVFASGCALVPWAKSPGVFHLVPIFLFALVCVANCLLIARLDRDRDIRRGEVSLAMRLPPGSRPARWLAVMVVLGAAPFFRFWPGLGGSLILAAFGLWCGVFIERQFRGEIAVVWADAVLLSPLLVNFGVWILDFA